MTEEKKTLESGHSGLARSGLGYGIHQGISGEDVNLSSVLESVGGVRGILEAFIPGLLFLTVYIFTTDIFYSAIAPVAVAIIFVCMRLAQRQPLLTSLSGLAGVVIAALTTMFTGKGENFFLPGFIINTVWSVALIISLLARYPLIGFIAGAVTGDPTGWRQNPRLYVAAKVASLTWLTMFILRLVVQLPLYFAGNITGLAVSRLVMGTPLFAIVIVFTWILFKRVADTPQNKN